MYQIFYLWYWWNNFLNINCVLYFCFSWNNYCPSKAFQVLTDIFVDFWQPANRVWWARFLCKFELYHACDIAGIVLEKRSLDVNLHITRFLLFRLNYCSLTVHFIHFFNITGSYFHELLFTSIPSKNLIFMHFYSLLYNQSNLFSYTFIHFYICMHFIHF